MFMFMEGLPRAGKSYETVAHYILPALQQGRPVDAYIEGLNYEKFAEVTGKPIEEIQELLKFIPAENVREIYKYTRKDALVVIDELQDFFQKGRAALSDEITRFVTQHGHEGQDIIGMGQDINDVHNIWRRRCARKFVFQKQDVVGKPDSYLWTAYAGRRTDKDIKFEKVNSGSRKYEERYFGLYKSHSDGTKNFETFKDDRTNLFKNNTFRVWLPLALAGSLFAVYYLYTNVFSGTGLVDQKTIEQVSVKQPSTPSFNDLQSRFNSQQKTPQKAAQAETEPNYAEPFEYIDQIAKAYRLRLSGKIKLSKDDDFMIVVEAYDSTMHVKERLTSPEIRALGWQIELTEYGARLHKGKRQYVVRPWPIDVFGRVNKTTLAKL